jgi:glycosidase
MSNSKKFIPKPTIGKESNWEVEEVKSLLTTDNAHLVAYNLYHEKPEVARALYEELRYWLDEEWQSKA